MNTRLKRNPLLVLALVFVVSCANDRSSPEISRKKVTKRVLGSAEAVPDIDNLPTPPESSVDSPVGSPLSFVLQAELEEAANRVTLTVSLYDQEGSDVQIEESETLQWDLISNLTPISTEQLSENQLSITFAGNSDRVYREIRRSQISVYLQGQEAETQLSAVGVLGSMLASPLYDNSRFRVSPRVTTVDLAWNYPMDNGATAFLITRSTGNEPHPQPQNGVDYNNGTSRRAGFIQITEDLTYLNAGVIASRPYEYKIWQIMPGLEYQLVGEWGTYVGSTSSNNFLESDLSSMSLFEAAFNGITRTNLNFAFADLRQANFSNATLDNTSFKGANLQGVNFSDASFGANISFKGANLTGATWIDGRTCLVGSIGQCLLP
ncbi:pentapeptide repeat-containing protein [Pseudobacteriovorax antillogorgiicola]|uniref:Pentapeptide repeat-containing protein n=1 Tax=Pseudobacteriovorax antillogorgiicola TaxID=1513793 RepID=A0A1Y6BKM0_9BACT|nr:pentapeptide repeat-containing protein [Pseudobacteriovorax antillogorgiicola]TCS55327.1 pentapeptide repeat protein [Pseudobacteriovorax antillogorgiicola]SMF14148.1 Pentapeptide repeat-containing protein [Pseudobacteriovorax antillogorgiicola]